MSNDKAIKHFIEAREHFLARRFDEARKIIELYKKTVDYNQFDHTDKRETHQPDISVVIVSYQTNDQLLECLKSVFGQQGSNFEVIVVDNGCNEAIHHKLADLPILHIEPSINLLPSEGRNIGTHFVRSDAVVFLDDDSVMAHGYLAAAQQAMVGEKFVGLRGRILPKTPNTAAQPPHYDLGDKIKPAEFNLEGNMVIRPQVLKMLGGFDPLMFGHEGKALSQQWRKHLSCHEILYNPSLLVYHDYAQNERLARKRERQALSKEYLQYLKEQTLNPGISIFIRAGNNLDPAVEFLELLVKHNSCQPLEILLWANNTKRALNLSSKYLGNFLIRVLPTTINSLARMAQKACYDNILIIDFPIQINSDVLSSWLQRHETDQKNALFSTKILLCGLADTELNSELSLPVFNLGKPEPQNKPEAAPEGNSTSASSKPLEKSQPNPQLTQKVSQGEEQIQQIAAQIAKVDEEIASLETQYLPLPESTPEKQELKYQLEDKVLASCRLLINLKDAQDKLQELRIREICSV